MSNTVEISKMVYTSGEIELSSPHFFAYCYPAEMGERFKISDATGEAENYLRDEVYYNRDYNFDCRDRAERVKLEAEWMT